MTDTTDETIPVLTCSVDEIVMSFKDPDSKLLSYISAYDEKDGDLTDRVILENVSPYVATGKADASFAVCDNDNHVGKLSVTVVYDDYTAPHFYLTKPLLLAYKSKSFTASSYVGVVDPIDGNTNDNIISVTDCITSNVGTYSLDLRVTNSHFDTSSLSLSVSVSANSTINPLLLSRYLVYCKVGDTIDYMTYINRNDAPYVSIDSSKVDLMTPGVYEVVYYIEGRDPTTLFVVCEE